MQMQMCDPSAQPLVRRSELGHDRKVGRGDSGECLPSADSEKRGECASESGIAHVLQQGPIKYCNLEMRDIEKTPQGHTLMLSEQTRATKFFGLECGAGGGPNTSETRCGAPAPHPRCLWSMVKRLRQATNEYAPEVSGQHAQPFFIYSHVV